MVQSDIIELLKSYGITNPSLRKTKDKVHDFAFSDFKKSKLDRAIGEPSLTSDKKVLIYTIPEVAKIGLCPSTGLLRFQDLTKSEGIKTSDSHLGFVKVNDALTQGFYQAQGNVNKRIPYMIALWKFLNKNKFEGRMTLPKIQVKTGSKTTRGQYQGAPWRHRYAGYGSLYV